MTQRGLLTGSTSLSQLEMDSKWKERDGGKAWGSVDRRGSGGHFGSEKISESSKGTAGLRDRKSTKNMTLPDKQPFLTPSFPLPPPLSCFFLRQDQS